MDQLIAVVQHQHNTPHFIQFPTRSLLDHHSRDLPQEVTELFRCTLG